MPNSYFQVCNRVTQASEMEAALPLVLQIEKELVGNWSQAMLHFGECVLETTGKKRMCVCVPEISADPR